MVKQVQEQSLVTNGTAPNTAALLPTRLDEDLRVELMTVTPALAQKWLKRNRANRKVRARHVMKLVNAMKSGAWDDANGATIVFSEHHELLDGQHRLLAVVEAQHPITTLVVFGVPEQKQATIDTGAMRLLGDYLSIKGYANSVNLSATVTVLAAYERGILQSSRRGHIFANYEEGVCFLEAHPGLATSISRVKKWPALMSPSHAACLDYLFARTDADLHAIWATTMQTGQSTAPYTVFLTLRERLLRDKTSKVKRPHYEAFVYNIKAWNAARAGTALRLFRWAEDEPIPSIT